MFYINCQAWFAAWQFTVAADIFVSPSHFPIIPAYVCTATCFSYARLLKDFFTCQERPALDFYLLLFHAFNAERVDEQMATLVENLEASGLLP